MWFQTYNTLYTLRDMGDGGFLISGHRRFCPEPVLVTLDGEPTIGKSVKFTYVDGEHIEGKTITTTPVLRLGINTQPLRSSKKIEEIL